MGTVSTLATVFAVVGWLVIAGVLILVVSGGLLTAQLLRSPQAGQLVAGLLLPYVLYSLVPFLAWGILRGLCEIHRQGEQRMELLDDIKRSLDKGSR